MKERFEFIFPKDNIPKNPFKDQVKDAEFLMYVETGTEFIYSTSFDTDNWDLVLERLAYLRPYMTSESRTKLRYFVAALQDKFYSAAQKATELRVILEAR